MKKYLIILSMFLLLCGCGKTSNENIIKNFKNKIEKNNSYILKGTMTITSNEDTFTYKVEASKSKDDYYKVSLINKTNDHEQIILKNSDGIYVVTPELNKSFKFQSDWPNNGSQSYLLDILVNDVVNDKEVHIDKSGENKYIQCKVNYPNNKTLYSEKIYLDNNYGVKKVEVLNQDGKIKISLEVLSINYKPKFDKTFFDLNKLIMYTDKNGLLTNTPKRKIFNICDMVISGEGEGPLLPSDKKVGLIVCSYNQLNCDYTIAQIMGFNPYKFKYIKNGYKLNKFVISKSSKFKIIDEKGIVKKMDVYNKDFTPTDGYKDYLKGK